MTRPTASPARSGGMQRLWFITNPASGSAGPEKCEAVEAVFADHDLELVGRTHFPDDGLPEPAALDAAGVDTVVLFAGDGTINAAVCALAEWAGSLLILPGGTMNMLAKSLHGDAAPAEIVHRAHEHAERVALPYVIADEHQAFVGLILGPAASWVHAREMMRAGRVRGLWRAVRLAWARTFQHSVRVEGLPALAGRAQAIFVRPIPAKLEVAAVEARDWRSILDLGWEWMIDDWAHARGVTQVEAHKLSVGGRRPVLALFDGEPQQLAPGTRITGGETKRHFLATAPRP